MAVALAAALAACSGIGKSKSIEVASNDKEAMSVKPQDPLARPVQVGWNSARASYCGFVFDPDRLRASFLDSEAQYGLTPEQMKKVVHAYDYSRQATYDTIKDNPAYCNKERTAAIRKDLGRYLAGDFSPTAQAAR
jgi:hypothetical protein